MRMKQQILHGKVLAAPGGPLLPSREVSPAIEQISRSKRYQLWLRAWRQYLSECRASARPPFDQHYPSTALSENERGCSTGRSTSKDENLSVHNLAC